MQRVSYGHMGIASMLNQCCGICHKRFRAALNDFGILAHAQCLRPYLLNVYYLKRDHGLSDQQYGALPCTWLRGYCGEVYTYK
eukprot:48913-Eustigmatos_ZCMA.PRE.1